MVYDFDRDVKLSHKYEDKFAAYLTKIGVADVKQENQNVMFEDWDIKSAHDTYEVKYDRLFQNTGNVLIETHSSVNPVSLGWFFKTKADWLVVFWNEHEFYTCKMKDLQDSWYDRWLLWEKITINQRTGRQTVCWIAPVHSLPFIRYGDIRK